MAEENKVASPNGKSPQVTVELIKQFGGKIISYKIIAYGTPDDVIRNIQDAITKMEREFNAQAIPGVTLRRM